jgi:hypothetical protein
VRISALALSLCLGITAATAAQAAIEQPQPRRASLVFFHFVGERPLVQAAQRTLPVHLAMRGYDRVVLLQDASGPVRVDPRDASLSDVIESPTRASFANQLRALASEHDEVDLWFFAHGSPKTIHAAGANITEAWLGRELGATSYPIRMVYQMNCHGSTLNDRWLSLGAKATMGSRDVNFYPTEFAAFASAWNRGESFARAVRGSDTAEGRAPVTAYIAGDALATRSQWGGCLPFSTIFSSLSCGQKYFEERWGVDYRRSVERTMRVASKKIVAGDGAVKKR